jgi:hypothetical protein
VIRDVARCLTEAFPERRMDLSLRSVSFLSDEVADSVQLAKALQRPDVTDLYCPDLVLPGVLYGFTEEDRALTGNR